MRPVNLIPSDERRGASAPLRTGSLVYVLVGGLALLLLGIVAVALTSKQIDDRKTQKASLEQQLQQETARANSLAAFTSFRAVQEQRAATVTSLAQSRFDWSRVLHELSLVLPSGVSLTNLTGSVSSDAQSSGGGSSSSRSSSGSDLRGAIAGPALEITGCAPGQDAVAGFVSALQDIDGVTRVGLSSSQTDNSSSGGGTSSGSSSGAGGSSDCQAGPNTVSFNITVAFDAVPTPPTATAAPSVPSTVSSSSTPTSTDQSQISDGQSEQNAARTSATQQVSKGQHAEHAFLGGGG
jgi:Tfp pilus assembly protein PilN